MMRMRDKPPQVATKQPKVEAVIEIHFVISHYLSHVQETHPAGGGALSPGIGGRDTRGLPSGSVITR
jgi:hypothetical protein